MIGKVKIALGCADCGYNAHPAALDFDHLPGEGKVRSISDMITSGASITDLDAEMDKCEVVCANCHRIRTYERVQQGKIISLEDTA